MNSELNQYPAALYSSVSEVGYRTERYTGETLRSGSGPRGTHRHGLLERVRHAFSRDGARRHHRLVMIHPMHEGR